ncbi:MAG: DUF6447 family protein [Methylococcaceae bacterium]
MAIIKINDVDYDFDSLSNEAKAQLASLRFVDNELTRLQSLAATYQTARVVYSNALKAALPPPFDYDSVKFY